VGKNFVKILFVLLLAIFWGQPFAERVEADPISPGGDPQIKIPDSLKNPPPVTSFSVLPGGVKCRTNMFPPPKILVGKLKNITSTLCQINGRDISLSIKNLPGHSDFGHPFFGNTGNGSFIVSLLVLASQYDVNEKNNRIVMVFDYDKTKGSSALFYQPKLFPPGVTIKTLGW